MRNDTIGVDISKDHLDAHRMSDGASRCFANDKAGHRAFLTWVGKTGVRIVYEPTGPYHRGFERRLADAGLALVKVNPRQARRFAEATGRLAKTDRLDAAMLARMGALLELEARPVRSPVLSVLKDLHMAREALVKSRTAAKNRSKNLVLPILKRHNTEQIRQIERQIAAIEAEIMAPIKADPDLNGRFDILVSIPGVAAIAACALIIDMPELGTSKTAGPPPSPPSLPSHANPATGPVAPSSAAAGPTSAKRSTCSPSSPYDSTPTSRPNTTNSSPPENRQRRPSSQS